MNFHLTFKIQFVNLIANIPNDWKQLFKLIFHLKCSSCPLKSQKVHPSNATNTLLLLRILIWLRNHGSRDAVILAYLDSLTI